MRFIRKIEDDANGLSIVNIIDSSTNKTIMSVEGSTILDMIEKLGEQSAYSAFIAAVEAYYPNLSKEEISALVE